MIAIQNYIFFISKTDFMQKLNNAKGCIYLINYRTKNPTLKSTGHS